MLEEIATIAELEAEATFLLEKQKTENQAKIIQIQGEVARASASARVYEDYIQMEVNRELDEVESNVYEEKYIKDGGVKIKGRKILEQMLKITNQMSRFCLRKKIQVIGWRQVKSNRSDAVKYGHLQDKDQPDMVAMVSKFLGQEGTPNADIYIFTGDPVDCHYFIAVFDEVIEKKIDDPQGRLTRLMKHTDGLKQPAAVGY